MVLRHTLAPSPELKRGDEAMAEAPCRTRGLATKEATFAALAPECKYDEAITRAILARTVESWHDFRYLCGTENQLNELVLANAEEPGKNAVQKARLRRAWRGVRSSLAARAALQPAADEEMAKELASRNIKVEELASRNIH